MVADPPTRESDVPLTVAGVNKSFATDAETVWAVRNVFLTAHAGEFVCIFGASGSGKSTLVNLMAGLDLPDSGTIVVGAEDMVRLDESGRARMRLERVGVVFQEDNLVEEFTAVENVALPLEVRGVHTVDARAQAVALLDRIGLAGLGHRYPRQLSGGQRQRVGIARGLVGGRRVLLADEPTGALDSVASQELFELVRALCGQGTAAVVCSHDPMCRDFADTVYEMVDGMLVTRSGAG